MTCKIVIFIQKKGVGYLAWKWIRISLESRMGCPDGSGTQTNHTSWCLKLHVSVSQCFGTKRTHSHAPGLKGEAFFSKLQVFLVCLPIVDQYEFVYSNLYYTNSQTLFKLCKFIFYMILSVWICIYKFIHINLNMKNEFWVYKLMCTNSCVRIHTHTKPYKKWIYIYITCKLMCVNSYYKLVYELVLIYDRRHTKKPKLKKRVSLLEPRYTGMCTFSTKKLRRWCTQFETSAHTISFVYQNHQDTPSKILDLYKSISMPDSQPLHTLTYHCHNHNHLLQ